MLLQEGRFTAIRLEKIGEMISKCSKIENGNRADTGKAISGQRKMRKGKSTGEALANFLQITALSQN